MNYVPQMKFLISQTNEVNLCSYGGPARSVAVAQKRLHITLKLCLLMSVSASTQLRSRGQGACAHPRFHHEMMTSIYTGYIQIFFLETVFSN